MELVKWEAGGGSVKEIAKNIVEREEERGGDRRGRLINDMGGGSDR